MNRFVLLLLMFVFSSFSLIAGNSYSASVLQQVKPSLVYIYQAVSIKPEEFSNPYKAIMINDEYQLKLFEPYISLGSGSGFFINDEGYLITNHHVIEINHHSDINTIIYYAEKIIKDGKKTFSYDEIESFLLELKKVLKTKQIIYRVRTSDAQEYTADLLSSTDKDDMALLKITGIVTAGITISDPFRIGFGLQVVALGFPYESYFERSNADFNPTVTEGRIAFIKNKVWGIMHNAVINHGNSGGPLVNTKGELIGINVAGNSRENIYYSIDTVKMMDWLKSTAILKKMPSGSGNVLNIKTGKYLFIDTKEGNKVFLNQKPAGVTPQILELPAGKSRVRIENDSESVEYQIDSDPALSVPYHLLPVFEAKYSELKLTVNDPEAVIYLDGFKSEDNLLILNRITPGDHQIVIKSQKYQLYSEIIRLAPGQKLVKNFQLQESARLLIEDQLPADTQIRISSGVITVTYTLNETIRLPEGIWQVSVKSEDDKDHATQITMGKEDYHLTSLIKIRTGTLILQYLKNTQKVFLNDQEVTGQIVNDKLDLAPGDYTLLVTEPGSMPVLRECEIIENEVVKMKVSTTLITGDYTGGITLTVISSVILSISTPLMFAPLIYYYQNRFVFFTDHLMSTENVSWDEYIFYKTPLLALFWTGFVFSCIGTIGLITGILFIVISKYNKNKNISFINKEPNEISFSLKF